MEFFVFVNGNFLFSAFSMAFCEMDVCSIAFEMYVPFKWCCYWSVVARSLVSVGQLYSLCSM